MKNDIRDTIKAIYVDGQPNTAVDPGSARKIAGTVTPAVGAVGGTEVTSHVCTDDRAEFRSITYGTTCAVALDVFVKVPGSGHELVIQFSKLGRYACLYWRKAGHLGVWFTYNPPKGWHEDSVSETREAVRGLGFHVLSNAELDEPYVGIPDAFASHDEDYASVRSLLFCFDGAH